MGIRTIAKGNWSSMKREMAGKMTSDVNGREEVTAAVAKEAKATRRGMPVQSAELPAYPKIKLRFLNSDKPNPLSQCRFF